MNRTLAATALILTAGLAACGAPAAAPRPAVTITITATPHSRAAGTSAPALASGTHSGSIDLSPSGRYLPPGPFRITPVYCGRLSAAQRTTYGTNAAGGLIYKFTNVSNTLTASASVSADFTDGTTVTGSNVAGAADLSQIGPGQSAMGEVDAAGPGGQNLKFTGCEIMDYGLITNSGAQPESFAP